MNASERNVWIVVLVVLLLSLGIGLYLSIEAERQAKALETAAKKDEAETAQAEEILKETAQQFDEGKISNEEAAKKAEEAEKKLNKQAERYARLFQIAAEKGSLIVSGPLVDRSGTLTWKTEFVDEMKKKGYDPTVVKNTLKSLKARAENVKKVQKIAIKESDAFAITPNPYLGTSTNPFFGLNPNPLVQGPQKSFEMEMRDRGYDINEVGMLLRGTYSTE